MKPYHFAVGDDETHVRVDADNAKEARKRAAAVLDRRHTRKDKPAPAGAYVLRLLKPGELFVKKQP